MRPERALGGGECEIFQPAGAQLCFFTELWKVDWSQVVHRLYLRYKLCTGFSDP